METGTAGGIDYLLVERYDRTISKAPDGQAILKRVHQEDFCQALGIVPENKYQAEGGPSLKQCFALVRDASSAPVIDLQALLDDVIFNFLIGNNDAHAKNFSLLYRGASDMRLAPLYDVLSTIYCPERSKKMAMKIGSEYLAARIAPKHFERLSEEAGLAKPMVKRPGIVNNDSLICYSKNRTPMRQMRHAKSVSMSHFVPRPKPRSVVRFSQSTKSSKEMRWTTRAGHRAAIPKGKSSKPDEFFNSPCPGQSALLSYGRT